MNLPKTFTVAGQTDIVLLRMSVRDAARAQGMTLADQARISLATSSIAEAIDVDSENPGQATVSECSRHDRVGIQVTYLAQDDERGNWNKVLGNIKWMVDDAYVERLPEGQIQVTLMKWKA